MRGSGSIWGPNGPYMRAANAAYRAETLVELLDELLAGDCPVYRTELERRRGAALEEARAANRRCHELAATHP